MPKLELRIDHPENNPTLSREMLEGGLGIPLQNPDGRIVPPSVASPISAADLASTHHRLTGLRKE